MRFSFWNRACRHAVCAFVCLVLFAGVCSAAVPSPLPAHEAMAVMDGISRGAGKLAAFEAAFTQEAVFSELPSPVRASGRVGLRKPGVFRWAYDAPSPSGFAVSGERKALWTQAGGVGYATPLRDWPGADTLPAVIINLLAFNGPVIRGMFAVEVFAAEAFSDFTATVSGKNAGRGGPEHILRLTPRNDMVRGHLAKVLLAFTPDGRYPMGARFFLRHGDVITVAFDGQRADDMVASSDALTLVPERTPQERNVFPDSGAHHAGNGPLLFSAMATCKGRKLPLLFAVDSLAGAVSASVSPPRLRVVAMSETLLRLGAVTVSGGQTVPGNMGADSTAEDLCTKLGNTVGRTLPLGGGPLWQYEEPGWSVRFTRVR